VTYQALWFHAFALTLAVELAVAFPLLRDAEPSRFRRVVAIVFANLASHPIVWFVIARVVTPSTLAIPVAEAWAVASEAVFYGLVFPSMGRLGALGVSAVVNAASFTVGLVVQAMR
jgi:hypothetical protein